MPKPVIRESQTECHACLFIPDPRLGSRVVPVLEEEIRHHRQFGQIHLNLWPYDVLLRPELAESAVACAARTDVVAIATDEDRGLNEELKKWLEMWGAPRGGSESRLVALFHSFPPDTPLVPAVVGDLANFAVRSGVGFVRCRLPATTPEVAHKHLEFESR